CTPPRVVIDYLAHHVEHATRLVVHDPRSFLLDTERGNDRAIVPDISTAADDVLRSSFLSRLALGVEALGIIGEALLHPHVGGILRRDVVAEPLVPALMHDDEVPLQSQAGGREIASQVAVLVMIAVGDGALMLHAEVRCLDELVAVRIPWVRTEPVLEAGEHGLDLLELLLGGVSVVRQRPEVEREMAALALEGVG